MELVVFLFGPLWPIQLLGASDNPLTGNRSGCVEPVLSKLLSFAPSFLSDFSVEILGSAIIVLQKVHGIGSHGKQKTKHPGSCAIFALAKRFKGLAGNFGYDGINWTFHR